MGFFSPSGLCNTKSSLALPFLNVAVSCHSPIHDSKVTLANKHCTVCSPSSFVPIVLLSICLKLVQTACLKTWSYIEQGIHEANVYCLDISVAPTFQNIFSNSRSAEMSQAFRVACLLPGDKPPIAQVLSCPNSSCSCDRYFTPVLGSICI